MKTKTHKRHLVRPLSQLDFTSIEILKDCLMLLLAEKNLTYLLSQNINLNKNLEMYY